MFYIVGTPLGNTEDISLRAVKTLVNSDIILAEDTRSFSNLYTKVQELFNLHPAKEQKIIAFYKDNEFEKLPQVLQWIDEGKEVSLVSESGMPLISDPGNDLIKRLAIAGTPFTVIPGPAAFVNAAVLSGFSTKSLLFLGFLPRKKGEIIQMFKHLLINRSKYVNPTIIFYESPHRIQESLKIIEEHMPGAKVAVAREMTKIFEEVVRKKDLKTANFKGELTVVVNFN